MNDKKDKTEEQKSELSRYGIELAEELTPAKLATETLTISLRAKGLIVLSKDLSQKIEGTHAKFIKSVDGSVYMAVSSEADGFELKNVAGDMGIQSIPLGKSLMDMLKATVPARFRVNKCEFEGYAPLWFIHPKPLEK